QQCACVLCHARIQRLDLAREYPAGISVDRQLDRLADLELTDELLRHGKIDAYGIERLQRYQGHAGGHELPLLHLAAAEAAGEWTEYGVRWNDGVGGVDGGLRGLALGTGGVEVGF